jgi:hypothetical protein
MPHSKYVSVFYFLSTLVFVSCRSEISEKEFLEQFKALSEKRINFKMNMKALGDSTFAHHDYAQKALGEVYQDSIFTFTIEEKYKAYTDSLQTDLEMGKDYFFKQWNDNKPLILTLEKTEMKHDNLIQSMKKGNVSESDGLDSLKFFATNLDAYIKKSDSLTKASTTKYWEFRKTFEEYRYNMRNLKYLYASKLTTK